MNEVVKTILNHKYADEKMKRQVFICQRSRKMRIKDKAFTKLFYAFMKENPVKIIGETVLMSGKMYLEFKRIEDDLARVVEARTEGVDKDEYSI